MNMIYIYTRVFPKLSKIKKTMISFILIINNIKLMIYKQKNDISSICIREIAYFFREDVKFMEIIRDRLLMKFWWNLEIFRIYIKP